MNRAFRSFLMVVIAAFALNAVASPVLAACKCMGGDTTMAGADAGETPCHAMVKGNAGKAQGDAHCIKCICDFCKVTSSADLPRASAGNSVPSMGSGLPFSTAAKNLDIVFGIEYPPRRTS